MANSMPLPVAAYALDGNPTLTQDLGTRGP